MPRDSTSDSSFCERIPSFPTSFSLDNLGYASLKYQNSSKMSNSHTTYAISSTANGFVHTSETIQEQDDIFEPISLLPGIDFSSIPVTFCHELESHFASINDQIIPIPETQDSYNKQSPKSATTLSSSSSPDSRNLNEYETGDSQMLVTASEGELSFGVETKVEKTIITQINAADSSSLANTSNELSLLTADSSSNDSSNNDSNYQEVKSGILKFESYSDNTKNFNEIKQFFEEKNLISNNIRLVDNQPTASSINQQPMNDEKKEFNFEFEPVSELASNLPQVAQEKEVLKFVFPIENQIKLQVNNSENEEVSSLVNNIVLDVISTAVPLTPESLDLYEIVESQYEIQIDNNTLQNNSTLNQSSPKILNRVDDNNENEFVEVKFDDFVKCSPEQKDGIKSSSTMIDQNLKDISVDDHKADSGHESNEELSNQVLIEPIDFESDCNNEISLNDDESVAYKKVLTENVNQEDFKSNVLNFEISVENDEISVVKSEEIKVDSEVKKELDSSASTLKSQSDNKARRAEIDPAVDCFSCSIL